MKNLRIAAAAALTLALLAACGGRAEAAPAGTRVVSTSGVPHHDVGNYTKSTYWTPGKPRGIPDSDTWRTSIDAVLDALAAEDADAYLHTGDMVSGRWGLDHDRPKANIFGPTGTLAQKKLAVRRAGDLYYRQNKSWWERAGIPISRVHFAMGDHEYGNTESDGVPRPNQLSFVEDHRAIWQKHFVDGRGYEYRHSDGQQGRTSYATVLPGGVGLVTLDPIVKKNGLLLTRIGGPQERWLDETLATLNARPDVRHVVVQVETPALGPNRAFHTGRQTLENGDVIYDLLASHDVDLLLTSEWHEITARKRGDGPVQIVHGSQLYRARANWLVIDFKPSGAIEVEAKALTGTRDATRKMWAPHRLRAPNEVTMGSTPTTVGRMTIDASSDVADASGLLALYE